MLCMISLMVNRPASRSQSLHNKICAREDVDDDIVARL
jgi:hypothetical protein